MEEIFDQISSEINNINNDIEYLRSAINTLNEYKSRGVSVDAAIPTVTTQKTEMQKQVESVLEDLKEICEKCKSVSLKINSDAEDPIISSGRTPAPKVNVVGRSGKKNK